MDSPQVKLLQDSGVEDAKLADAGFLASKAEVHARGVAREEGVLVELFNPITVGLAGVLLHLKVDALAAGQALFVGQEGSPQHQQDTVKEAMDNLEATGLAAPRSGEVPLVASLALLALVLEGDIGNLEDLDWDAVALVLANGLEQTR